MEKRPSDGDKTITETFEDDKTPAETSKLPAKLPEQGSRIRNIQPVGVDLTNVSARSQTDLTAKQVTGEEPI